MPRSLRDAAPARRRGAPERRPDVFVAIDFPDFNFRLMAALRRLGIPVVYYVSPQLWAWRPGRMKTMKADVDRVLVIFPFEEAIYRGRRASTCSSSAIRWSISPRRPSRGRRFFAIAGLDPEAPTVALLPGSRRQRARADRFRRWPPALALIRARVPDVQFTVACAPNIEDAAVRSAGVGRRRTQPSGARARPHDDVIASADVAITASGTATVQCALHERPMVVVYRLSPLTYRLGKPFVNVDTYAMPNLVAGRRIVPELIQDDFTPERVADETVALLTDSALHARTRQDLRGVRQQLGAPGASGRAADAVLAVAAGAKSA